MAKTVNSDIWSLCKESIIFHLMIDDTERFSWKKKKQTSFNDIL